MRSAGDPGRCAQNEAHYLPPLAWVLLGILRRSIIESAQTGGTAEALQLLVAMGYVKDGRITPEGLSALQKRARGGG